DKLVMANLYSWYGHPDGPMGEYRYEKWQKYGDLDDWAITESTMVNVTKHVNSTISAFNATGTCINTTNNTMLLTSELQPFSLSTRIYFKINARINNMNYSSAMYFFRINNVIYETRLDLNNSFKVIRKVYPYDFNKSMNTGPNQVGIKIVAKQPSGSNEIFSLLVKSVILSGWSHYNEDYLTYYNETTRLWFNHPPFTKATDKNVYFPGNISDALGTIPSYGVYFHNWTEKAGKDLNLTVEPQYYYGIYDSLNKTVLEAQLRLMHWAGIDVVMLMHPRDFYVARCIMDVAWDLKTRFEDSGNQFDLKFVYYHVWQQMNQLLFEIQEYEHYNDLYLKVQGKPVFFVGPTGLLSEPYTNFREEFNNIRSNHDVFMVGDGYIPPKEEMLYLLDGFYFYDTSGMMRQGYGDGRIVVYQPDGSPSTGSSGLYELFKATSSIAHAHGCIYAATVIPGTDNTCVHDFEGSPLYDGRPGTIIERTGGFTFNYTWACSINADADWITITSWNELHEGTEIEPTLENGTFYIELCKSWSNAFKS
ncbi:MAG: hypothetical protein ACTSRA_09955, partial [Promethearchaeota archaeon]